jgi:adenylosuccinate synthase
MSSSVVIGLQWGDEGKGKIVDLLSDEVDLAVRCQGGANAGHTVEIGDEKYVLHLVPTGILRPDVRCLIGNGVVVDLSGLFRELSDLYKRGVRWEGRLYLSVAAHVVLPYHRLLDQADEHSRSGAKIGTTLRGIGPAYADKMARRGVRIGDLYNPEALRTRLALIESTHRAKIETLTDVKVPDVDAVARELEEYAAQIKPFLVNAAEFLHDEAKAGRTILFEGAQGTLLDVDFGTYPYVTSSTTTVGGVMTGLGVPPRALGDVVGVTKAYCTRVGNGPFPTELTGEFGERLRSQGHEYGATTGRPRRCGWLDGVLLRHACRINGVTHLTVTKLDVLDELETIKICTHYEEHTGPLDVARLEGARPVYEEWPGWKTPTSDIKTYDQLPAACRKYLERVAELGETELAIVSTGPRRSQTIVLKK